MSRPSRLATSTGIYLLLLITMVSGSAASSFAQTPRFRDYPVTEQYRGRTHAVVLTRSDRMFRTRLREAAKEKPNFAGHYILTKWGCGTECLAGALIDARTGRVYMLPHTLCCWGAVDDNFNPIEFRLNSKLLVFSGARNEKEGDNGVHYYKFENNRFVLIRSVIGPN